MANLLVFISVSVTLIAVSSLCHADTLLLTPDEQKEVHKDIAIEDHGVHGELFLIDEEDMIEVLKRRLLQLKESGKLEAVQKEFQDKAKKSVLEPRAVPHITPTVETRVFYVDPTLKVEGDITLPEGIPNGGHILAKKGDRINPLHTLKPNKGLLFIDGDNPAQIDHALKTKDAFDIVLVSGKPIELEERLNIPIFFDQGGIITKRYGITHVPAKMEVDGDRLKFTEFKL